jgi:hypothetical protein
VRAADTVLARLAGVKSTGKGRWMAKCPAHDDGSPSLSIREMDDGKLLLHDFGGCGSLEVLGALGLSLSDLFADRLTHHTPPLRGGFTAEELLIAIEHETFVARLILQEAKDGPLTQIGMSRLDTAIRRIGNARIVAYGK